MECQYCIYNRPGVSIPLEAWNQIPLVHGIFPAPLFPPLPYPNPPFKRGVRGYYRQTIVDILHC